MHQYASRCIKMHCFSKASASDLATCSDVIDLTCFEAWQRLISRLTPQEEAPRIDPSISELCQVEMNRDFQNLSADLSIVP